jgi:hypothetical protein
MSEALHSSFTNCVCFTFCLPYTIPYALGGLAKNEVKNEATGRKPHDFRKVPF